jgi:VanZ family protein
MTLRQTLATVVERRRVWLALGYTGWLAITVLSLLPASDRPHTGYGGFSEHFVAYLLVALCLALGSAVLRNHMVALPLVAGSIILELAQRYIPGRTSEIQGVTSALSGVIVALVIAHMVRRVRAR